MTIDELTTILLDVEARYRRLDAAMSAARAAGCLDIEGELHNAAWHVFDGWIRHLDKHFTDGWLSWWIYDNEFGRKAFEASGSRKARLRSIRTARQMARLILDSRK
jgi:hypothetical protein